MTFLKPLSTPIKDRSLWGFDIETYGKKNKFLMGSIIGDHGINQTFWDKFEFIDFLTKYNSRVNNRRDMFCKGYIAATNLNFDIMALIDGSYRMEDIYPVIRGSDMIACKLKIDKKRTLTFIDTMNYAKFSVKTWGERLNCQKLPHPDCLGKKVDKDSYQGKKLAEYNLRDSLITYKAMKFLQNGFNKLGAELRVTVASTAMDLYRRQFQKNIFYQPRKELIQYMFNAYYGGRTEAVKRGRIKNLNYYDFNSLYPAVMFEKEYPSPNNFKYSRNIKHNTIQKYEGIAHVKIRSPDNMYIPYLPCRKEFKGIGYKLIFPLGTFTGHYTFYELRKAVSLGYQILEFYSGVIYFRKQDIFSEYVRKLYDLRKQQKQDDHPEEIITKLLMNSLSGKFSQKIDEKEVIVPQSKVTMDMMNRSDRFYRSGNFFIFKMAHERIPAFVNPIISIYTTAYARDKLYDTLSDCGRDIYYYDTDSLITSRNYEDSKELGMLKKEYKIKEGVIVKPKMYMFDDNVRCKGLGRMVSGEFNMLLKHRQRSMTRFVKFKEANKRELDYNEIIDVTKTVSLEDDKRAWQQRFDPELMQDSKALSSSI